MVGSGWNRPVRFHLGKDVGPMLNENLHKTQSSSAETKSFLIGNTMNELDSDLIESKKSQSDNIHIYDC
jgi:hypothetical protein